MTTKWREFKACHIEAIEGKKYLKGQAVEQLKNAKEVEK